MKKNKLNSSYTTYDIDLDIKEIRASKLNNCNIIHLVYGTYICPFFSDFSMDCNYKCIMKAVVSKYA